MEVGGRTDVVEGEGSERVDLIFKMTMEGGKERGTAAGRLREEKVGDEDENKEENEEEKEKEQE